MTVQELCNRLQHIAHDGKALMEITDINGDPINVFEDEDGIYIHTADKQG